MELNFISTLIKHDVNHNLIVERYHKERNLPMLDKSKFLVPEDITMSQFLVIIRNRIKVKPNQLYVERYSREREVPALGRNKFLVPQELTMSQFLYIIRTKMKLRDSQVLVSHSMTMAQAYEQFRADDGYLHITYAAQQVF
ncbi:Microtubule-associated protein 1 light chain 3, partial [Operophtera brumata]